MNHAVNDPNRAKRTAAPRGRSLPVDTRVPEKAITLALRLANAENALHALTSGQIDAVVGPGGKTYLMHSAQEDLRRSEMALQNLFDSASDLITVINRGGEIVFQNRAVIRLLGCEPEQIVGESLFKLIHTDDVTKVRSAFFSVIDGFRDDATFELQFLHGDGSYRMLEASVSKLRDAAVSRVVLICRDTNRSRKPLESHSP